MPGTKPRTMPKFTPAPDALVERFVGAIGEFPEAELRKMFGYPAAFVNGQMFAGLFGENMMLRLSSQDRALLSKKGAKPFEPMPGRVMTEYVVVPDPVLKSPRQLSGWLGKSIDYARSLPPKSHKSSKPKTRKT